MVYLLLIIVAFAFMEFVAWFSHKYVMHGFLWKWHKDHHINDHTSHENEVHQYVEKNDLFFLVFASPAIVLLIIGILFVNFHLIAIGAGITLYGLTYFTIHDVAIHQRIPLKFLKKSKLRYFNALIEAHKGHHHPKNKKDFDSYGLLLFPSRYLKSKK